MSKERMVQVTKGEYENLIRDQPNDRFNDLSASGYPEIGA